MDATLLLNGISFLSIAFLGSVSFLKLFYFGGVRRTIGSLLAAIGICYFLIGTLCVLWAFGITESSGADFQILLSAITIIVSSLLCISIYKIAASRHILYLFLLYIASLFAIQESLFSFLLATVAISLLLLLTCCVELLFFRNHYLRKAGLLGVGFALSMLVFFGLASFGIDSLVLPWFASSILLFAIMLSILRDVVEKGVVEGEKKKRHALVHLTSLFIKFALFIFSISAFSLLSIIGLHEFGHALIAQYYGCESYKAVIYDVVQSPHTEISCSVQYNDLLLTLAGLLITTLVGFLFLIIGDKFTYRLSTLLLGYGLLVSYGDLGGLGISQNILIVLMMLALIAIILSIIRLSVYYLQEYHLLEEDLEENLKRVASGKANVEKIPTYHVGAKHIK